MEAGVEDVVGDGDGDGDERRRGEGANEECILSYDMALEEVRG